MIDRRYALGCFLFQLFHRHTEEQKRCLLFRRFALNGFLQFSQFIVKIRSSCAIRIALQRVATLSIALFFVSLASSTSSAQNARYDNVALTRGGFPAAGATIAVCSQPATTTTQPCTPLAPLCSSLIDLVCNQPNPITADGLGNYSFYVAPGTYTIQIYGSGFTTKILPDQGIGTGGGGGGGSPGGSNGDVQTKSGTSFSTSAINDNVTIPGAILANREMVFLGPTPHTDIRAYGGQIFASPNVPPALPGITANCSSGSPIVTLSTPSLFANNGGITLWGCGATNTTATPGAPTITPSIASGPTGTGMVVNAPTSVTSYTYSVVAVRKNGGYTVASTPTTITTGNSLGWQTVAITSLAKTNNIVTATTAAHKLVVGSLIFIGGTTDSLNFGGWYLVATVPDNTHFTYKTASDTRVGGTTSATGGVVGWFNCNHITWSAVSGALYYLIYDNNGTGPIGVSKLQNSTGPTITDTEWDDFGLTIRGTPVFLSGQFPLNPPSAATNDSLTTTIISGGGTTTLTLAASPVQTISGATALGDDAPAIAAAQAATGQAYLPAGTTVINSYLTTPVLGAIYQQGSLQINGMLELGQNTQWYGNVLPMLTTVLSFANGGGAPVTCGTAPGCVFAPHSNSTLKIKGLAFTTRNNGYGMIIDNTNGIIARDMNFSGPGGAEGMTMPLLVRLASFEQEWSNITMLGSQGGDSTTPLFFCNGCSSLRMNLLNLSGRGIFFNGLNFMIDYGRKQGGKSPAIFRAALSGPADVGGIGDIPFTMDDVVSEYELDTDANPLIATVTPANSTNQILHQLVLAHGLPTPSSDSGGAYPVISNNQYTSIQNEGASVGTPYNSTLQKGFFGTYGTNANGHLTYGIGNTSGQLGQFGVNENINIGAGNALTIPFVTIPVPTAAVITGGSCTSFPPAGTYSYRLSVVGPDTVQGSYGNTSNSITLNGTTQCGSLTWTDTPGVIGYKVYVSGGAAFGEISQGTCNSFNAIVAANNCVDVHTFINNANPILNGTGNPTLWPGFLSTNKIVLGSTTGGNYGTSTIQGNFTASRTVTVPDATGTFMLFTGTPANNDCAKFIVSGSIITATSAGAACGAGGSSVWSALTNPVASLSLSMAGNTSTFNTTSALAQFFAWKNTTAAVVGTSQGSPNLALCGRAFHASADVEDCLTLSELPGNGNDAAIAFNINHTGTSTGVVTTNIPGPLAIPQIGGVGGMLTLSEGTVPAAFGGAALDNCYADSTAHQVLCKDNNGTTRTDTRSPTSTTANNVPVYADAQGNLAIGKGVQGTDANLLTAGTISGTSATLCTDANGGATTTACGGSSALSAITAAVAANSINNGDNAQTWNWALTTAAKTAFTFTESTAATNGVGSQWLTQIGTIAGSTAVPLRITQSLTGSQALNAFQLAPTWNTSGAPTAFLINPTNTASGTASLLADFQLAGTSQWKIDKAGNSTQLGTASLGASPPTCAAGTAGGACNNEGTAITGAASVDDFYADSTQHALEVNNNNTGNMPISRVVCVNVTPVTVNTSTTSDQNLMSCTLSANLLNVVGRTLKVTVAGVYSTAAASTASITMKAKLCTVSGCGSGTVITPLSAATGATAALSATNLMAQLYGNVITQTAGATSSYESQGNMLIDLSATATVASSAYPAINTATVGTIDSTAGLFLQITGAFSAASASNSMTERQLIVEVVN